MSSSTSNKSGLIPPALKVEDVMTSTVHSVSPEMTVRDAIVLLTGHGVSGAPLIDALGKVISVVSEGDLLKLAATEGLEKALTFCLAKLPKTEKLITLRKSNTFSDAYRLFLTHPVHRIIITDGNGKLQGIVSRSNILRILGAKGEDKAS
jgi:CBS domain-containing protein